LKPGSDCRECWRLTDETSLLWRLELADRYRDRLSWHEGRFALKWADTLMASIQHQKRRFSKRQCREDF